MFRISLLAVSACLVLSPVQAASHLKIDRSASIKLQGLADVCSGVLADAVANTQANQGKAIKGDDKAATQELRSQLSDCSATYLDAVDGVLDKFVANSAK